MTIGDVASKTGLAASTLRFYEKEQLLRKPARISGRRVYDDSIFSNLRLIQMTLESGFSVREARLLISGFTDKVSPSKRWRSLANKKLKDVRTKIDSLRHAEQLLSRAVSCDCLNLDQCADLLLGRVSINEAPRR
jgi:MerR family transcriptional regulator, redox-sensitive transcriptional activator SoxR